MAGSRPNVSVQFGELSEHASDLRKMDLFPINHVALYVKDTLWLHTLKYPCTIDVTRPLLGTVTDRSMGELRSDKCVDPRARCPWILGAGIPGGRYQLFGQGSK